MITRNLEGRIGMLSSDISGTILHNLHTNDMRPEGCFTTVVDAAGREIHERTHELLKMIMNEGVIIALVTGMRETSYREVKKAIPHDYGIIELGGIILTGSNVVYDSGWYTILQE